MLSLLDGEEDEEEDGEEEGKEEGGGEGRSNYYFCPCYKAPSDATANSSY